eukprot:5555575-Pleurochrysis_carterae.AAC.2
MRPSQQASMRPSQLSPPRQCPHLHSLTPRSLPAWAHSSVPLWKLKTALALPETQLVAHLLAACHLVAQLNSPAARRRCLKP